MAKKKYDYRAQQAHKRNQQKIADAKAKQKQKEFLAKHSKHLIIGAVAVVLVIAALCMFGGLIRFDGSLPTLWGKLHNVEENWIVANVSSTSKARYYKMGEYTAPEGYTLDEAASASSDLSQAQYYTANDEAAVAQSVYVSGVGGATASDMANMVTFYYADNSGVKQTSINGHDVQYVYVTALNTEYDEEGNVVEIPEEEQAGGSMLAMYVDSVQDSCVLVNVQSAELPKAEIPTEEALLAAAEPFFTNLVVEK